jgi:hypothetical protein
VLVKRYPSPHAPYTGLQRRQAVLVNQKIEDCWREAPQQIDVAEILVPEAVAPVGVEVSPVGLY